MVRRPRQHVRRVRTRYGRRSTVVNRGIWYGERYKRKESNTFRNRRTGIVTTTAGRPVNFEPTRQHTYGYSAGKDGFDQRKVPERFKKKENE